MSTGPRTYCPTPLHSGHRISLDEQSAGHLVRVLRLTDGDSVRLFCGDGHEYAGALCNVSKKGADVMVGDILRSDTQQPLHLHLGQVVSKGDRMDFTIQKATELGIAEITPLWSERCEVRLKGERLDKKVEHWQKVAISACEQSGRNRIPVINEPVYFADWAKSTAADLRFILHPHDQKPLRDYEKPASLALLVGPEGGFSDVEVAEAVSAGFAGLTLGPRILRTETAALAALSVFQFQWGDF